jgi:hypothetical protein
MAKRIRIGDVIEIQTRKGLAYAQFTHKHPRYSALIRVLPAFSEERPNDLRETVEKRARFVTFIPLQAAVNRSLLAIVANYPVPEEAQKFPLFRAGMVDPRSRKVEVWWLWDGEKEWRVGDVAPEQWGLPILGIWNDTMLIHRIESGWTPEIDSRR